MAETIKQQLIAVLENLKRELNQHEVQVTSDAEFIGVTLPNSLFLPGADNQDDKKVDIGIQMFHFVVEVTVVSEGWKGDLYQSAYFDAIPEVSEVREFVEEELKKFFKQSD